MTISRTDIDLLRSEGKTYQEIANKAKMTRQAVYYKTQYTPKGGKTQRIIKNLKLDSPIFLPNGKVESILNAARRLKIKIVTRIVKRNGKKGVWVCRIV